MKNGKKSVLRLALSFFLALLMVMALAPQTHAAGNGSITITASGSGDKEVNPGTRDFKAYKILDFQPGTTKGTGVYTVPDALFQAYHDFFTTATTATPHPGLGLTTGVPTTKGPNFDKFVQDTLHGLTEAQRRDFVAFMMPKVEASGITAIDLSKDEANKTAKATGLDLGYYIIKDTTTTIGEKESRALVSLTTTEPAASVEIKAGKTPGKKKIVENGQEVDQNTAAIGDTVNYRYTTNVSSQLDHFKRYSFEFQDELCKGLDLLDDNNKGFTIKIGSASLKRGTAYNSTEHTVTGGDYYVETKKEASGETKVTIHFNDLKKITGVNAGDAITIEYAAKVNKDATPAETGNPNTARVKYSNDPNEDDGGTPKGTVPDSTVKTYLTEIELLKFHKNGGQEDPLAGAEFELTGEGLNLSVVTYEKFVEDANGTYWKLTNGTYTTTDPNGQGVDKSVYVDVNKKYKVEKGTDVLGKGSTPTDVKATTGPDGKIKFTGLKPGTYTLTETKAPYGYNKLADPIKFTISVKLPGEKDANNQTLTEPKWTYVTEKKKDTDPNLFDGTTINLLKIENKQGSTIPGLGGAGTTMLYIVASVLFLGAAIFIVSKKRAEQKDR